MTRSVQIKNKAIRLRRKGLSYLEISRKLHIAKSTLSIWLRGVEIPEKYKKILLSKTTNAHILGAKASRKKRIEKTRRIIKKASREIEKITKNDLFLLGTMLYWGEGTKQKPSNISQGVEFTNSDPRMCRIFLKWLNLCLDIPQNDLIICIYIHISHKYRVSEVLQFWSNEVEIDTEKTKVYFTKTTSLKKNKSKNYHGQLRIRVKKSTDINRRIIGWVNGVCIQSEHL